MGHKYKHFERGITEPYGRAWFFCIGPGMIVGWDPFLRNGYGIKVGIYRPSGQSLERIEELSRESVQPRRSEELEWELIAWSRLSDMMLSVTSKGKSRGYSVEGIPETLSIYRHREPNPELIVDFSYRSISLGTWEYHSGSAPILPKSLPIYRNETAVGSPTIRLPPKDFLKEFEELKSTK